jgi:protein CWC15
MTTAHRPTWNAAVGGKNQAGNARMTLDHSVSGKDLPAHKTLKVRAKGQDTEDELGGRDLVGDLEERERAHFEKVGKPEMAPKLRVEETTAALTNTQDSKMHDDKDDSDSDDSEDSDDSDGSDEEDTAELLKELEKIKKEKAEQARLQEETQRADHEREQEQAVMAGNPLINASEGFQVKRRWDDDVVFKNQSRGAPVQKKRFVNDAIRNDFHKKFLSKYIV